MIFFPMHYQLFANVFAPLSPQNSLDMFTPCEEYSPWAMDMPMKDDLCVVVLERKCNEFYAYYVMSSVSK